MAGPSSQARLTLQDAFERFARSVTPDDERLFNNTTLKDVRDEAIRVERQLRERRTQRHMIRLEPLLRGMEHYSKVIEVLCNGTPYLSWIWAPVKLMLMVTIDSLGAFEKLIEAYGKIADMMPRLDRLENALRDDHNFQNVLALLYSDIVEFHRRAYKFVRRKSWAIFFGSMWAGFESRFNTILKNLAYHSELVTQEAASADISNAVHRHQDESKRWEQQEREWMASKIRTVISWLGTDDPLPDDVLERHSRHCFPTSCDWFIHDRRTQLWLSDGTRNGFVWVYGKPGAGKSTICSSLIQHAEANGFNILFYFCSYLGDSNRALSRLFQSLVSQIIQKHQDLAVYVHDVYFKTYPIPSKKALLRLLPELLKGLGSTRLVIDGMDEWNADDQKEILQNITQLVSIDPSSHICKVLISSRDTLEISRNLRSKKNMVVTMSLSDGDESLAIAQSIGAFVDNRLSQLPDHFMSLDPDGSILRQVKQGLLEKSTGMFLWVRLVLDSLETTYSPEDLRSLVHDLPSDLNVLYNRILVQLCSVSGPQKYGGVSRIISWICFARRPLNKYELLHGLADSPITGGSNAQSVPIAQILDHCKPLVEERSDSTVALIHFSVKEFFLKSTAPQIVPSMQAQLDIASVCVSTLIRGFELLSNGVSKPETLVRIASGNYRLLPYAIEFWIEHCLQFASTKAQLNRDHPISAHLAKLHSWHGHCQGNLDIKTDSGPADILKDLSDSRLQSFAHMPIHELMIQCLHTRWLASQQNCEKGEDMEEFTLQNDRTHFSRLATEFEKAVIHLLSQFELGDIPKITLDMFHKSYASTAFRCRFPNCRKSSTGFGSLQLRAQHENGHLRRVYCQRSSCQYSRIGFANKHALRSHTRNYHDGASKMPIPPKLRRSKEESKPTIGDEVFVTGLVDEGLGILCRVLDVEGEGKSRVFRVIDADPDLSFRQPFDRATANTLVTIPQAYAQQDLHSLWSGTDVLALYPETTTFYIAKVRESWIRGKEPGQTMVLIHFVEDDNDRFMSVERRYVLHDTKGLVGDIIREHKLRTIENPPLNPEQREQTAKTDSSLGRTPSQNSGEIEAFGENHLPLTADELENFDFDSFLHVKDDDDPFFDFPGRTIEETEPTHPIARNVASEIYHRSKDSSNKRSR